ncbi:MAG: phosphotransferase enzyme family protein [Crocinitomicaceae bacterium]
MDELIHVISNFLPNANSKNIEITPVNSGLINSTYKVDYKKSAFILQKLNQFVFKDPNLIQDNYKEVLREFSVSAYSKKQLEFLETNSNRELVNYNNTFWRMSKFIKGKTYPVCKSLEMAYSAAKSLAEFHLALIGLDYNHINEPIKDFCNFNYRIQQYRESTINGDSHRLKNTQNFMGEIESNLKYIHDYIKIEKDIKKRIIHGDPKVSNFLFDDKTHKVISIIDIDTIMPGSILFDFGDMVRSFANKSYEDSQIKERIFNPDIYNALKEGYLSEANEFLSPIEKESLDLSALTVVLIQCIRFLTDYYNLDVYYHVNEPEHNLKRAINQFSFFKELKANLKP